MSKASYFNTEMDTCCAVNSCGSESNRSNLEHNQLIIVTEGASVCISGLIECDTYEIQALSPLIASRIAHFS